MSVVYQEIRQGVTIGTDDNVFYGKYIINDDGSRSLETLVQFAKMELLNDLSTTDDAVTTISTIAVPEYTNMMVEARIVARRTGGTAGTDGDGLGYHMTGMFKRTSGNATQTGSTVYHFNEKEQIAWDVVFSTTGTNIIIQVNGAVDNDIDWVCYYTTHYKTTIVELPPP